ncbi:MAG: 4a-hydroxytetrahydrobiopterin dehydratase [Proteobacteria bacterium]|nr:4a-hydroxytetrahydrobiopterin dehydratase [Pseudomonadota bacterium]
MTITTAELLARHCAHCEQGLSAAQVQNYLSAVAGWQVENGKADGNIVKTFAFQNYYETLAFVNAIAYVIHAEDHHPDLLVGYNRCTVKFNTHSVNDGKGGLSENDFICAAKVDAVFATASTHR